jgi:hypothetical protein
MIRPEDIGWGSYMQYEGPFFRGVEKYTTPSDPTEAQKWVAVLTATESGRYDAINMYDRMIISVGLIQWGEAGQHKVSDLLGEIARTCPDNEHVQEFLSAVKAQKYEITPASGLSKKTRLRSLDGKADYVDTIPEQQQFWLSCSGKKGAWSEDSRYHAKAWAARVANVLAIDEAKRIQEQFTGRQMQGFISDRARAVLQGMPLMTAAYLSYAANLPAIAEKHLLLAASRSTHKQWSAGWVTDLLRELTFGPGITIYPIRYNAIRPVLERWYGADLPDFAADLARVQETVGGPLWSVKEIQEELIACGVDLGPKGADGILGPKTKAGVRLFQFRHGLVQDGIVGQKTLAALMKSRESRAIKSVNEERSP